MSDADAHPAGLRLEQVIPWGRDADEYVWMFDLRPGDLGRSILDGGGGPASFNAELTAQGGSVLSVDPLYAFSAAEIERRISETCPVVLDGLREARDGYLWTGITSPEALAELRLRTMRAFLRDYEVGRAQGRYLEGALPDLPLPDDRCDLALCSHFLFTYSAQFGLDFHLRALRELLRVAPEVRVFPLLSTTGGPSPWLPPVLSALTREGHGAQVLRVPYEFQRGANEMLVVKRRGQS